ncbi:unnamed protein product [Boreogadus saida]
MICCEVRMPAMQGTLSLRGLQVLRALVLPVLWALVLPVVCGTGAGRRIGKVIQDPPTPSTARFMSALTRGKYWNGTPDTLLAAREAERVDTVDGSLRAFTESKEVVVAVVVVVVVDVVDVVVGEVAVAVVAAVVVDVVDVVVGEGTKAHP